MAGEIAVPRISRRSPAAATLLSFIMAGLGHIYCGRFGKGIFLFFISSLLGSMGGLALLFWGTVEGYVCLGLLGVSLVVWLYAIVDAGRLAGRAAPDYVLRDYNRWYVYLLLVLLPMPTSIGWSRYIRAAFIQAFHMEGNGMAPAIQRGERVLVNKLAYKSEPVRRGDVVALINPDKRSQHNIKRVVALPGERVEVRQGELILNGRRLGYTSAPAQRAGAFPGAVSWEHGVGRDHLIALPTTQEAAATDLPETTVPKGHCLVLNDNRGNTYDSRQYGPVPLADIIGRAEYVYWPRWARLSP